MQGRRRDAGPKAIDQVRLMARRWAAAADGRGLAVTFHDDMPAVVPELHVAIEAIEGRHDDEATLIRNSHLFEGGARLQLPLTPRTLGERECMARIDAWMAPAVRLMEEERDMLARGVDPLDPPLEELVANPLVRDVIAWADVHSSAYRVDRTDRGGLVHPPGGIAQGRISMKAVRQDDRFMMSLHLGGRRLRAARIVLKGDGRIRIVEVDRRDVEITVIGRTLPESAVAAAVGRTLGELLEHPVLDRARCMEVVGAENRGDGSGSMDLVITARGTAIPAHPAMEGGAACGR